MQVRMKQIMIVEELCNQFGKETLVAKTWNKYKEKFSDETPLLRLLYSHRIITRNYISDETLKGGGTFIYINLGKYTHVIYDGSFQLYSLVVKRSRYVIKLPYKKYKYV